MRGATRATGRSRRRNPRHYDRKLLCNINNNQFLTTHFAPPESPPTSHNLAPACRSSTSGTRTPSPNPTTRSSFPKRPPGLEAIRAWIGKPRPWLRGIQLWIKHIREEGPETWKRFRERGLRAARWLRRALGRIAPATRPVAQLGEIIRELGEMICRVADELRDLLGKQTDTGTQFREVGRIAQRAGALIVSTTRLSGKALAQLGRLLALLAALETAPEPVPPPGPPKQPPETDPVPPGDPKPDPRPDESPAEEQPEPQPGHTPPDGSGRAPSESATPSPAPHVPAEGTPEAVPPTPPDPTPELPPEPSPDPSPEPDPDPSPEPAPEADPTPDPTPEPAPDASPSTPAPPSSEPTPAIPSEADLKARLEGVPDALLPQVRAAVIKGRSPRDVLHPLILEICYRRDWTTAKQLARWLDMHQASLTERHLGPLVRAGLLELKYPDRPSSPQQAYRTCRDRWPPRH